MKKLLSLSKHKAAADLIYNAVGKDVDKAISVLKAASKDGVTVDFNTALDMALKGKR